MTDFKPDATHPFYDANIGKIERSRDFLSGEDAVKGKGRKYLTTTINNKPSDFKAMLDAATFFNATSNTVDAMVGAIMRRDPTVEWPSRFNDFLEDVTGDGMDFFSWCDYVIREICATGSPVSLVDYNEAGRPFIANYNAESHTNWNPKWHMFKEVGHNQQEDGTWKERTIYRQTIIEGNVYKQYEYRKLDNGKWEKTEKPVSRNSKTGFTELPVEVAKIGLPGGMWKIPILDLVNKNWDLYRVTAIHRDMLPYLRPTLTLIGGQEPEGGFKIGPRGSIIIPNVGAQVTMTEPQGTGVAPLDKTMESIKLELAELGAAMFQGQKGNETATTARINQSGRNARLINIVTAADQFITNTMRNVAMLHGMDESARKNINVTLNRDFLDIQLDPALLREMLGAVQAGKLSMDSFLHNLYKGELLSGTVEEEKLRIQAEEPDDMPEPKREEVNV